ncbi:MAG: aldehyde dehydrogenase [Cyclobacteriaceae bacterium]
MSTSIIDFDLKTALQNAHFEGKRAFFDSGATRPYRFRKQQLKKLKSAISTYEKDISKALFMDLGKPDFESYISEIAFMHVEIDHTLKHLRKWMRTKKVSTPLTIFPASSKIIREPLGVTLIIGAWNYPFQLLLAPLIGAIAGGNAAVIKPSELTPHTARVIETLIDETFDRDYISVVQGEGSEVVPALLDRHRFDHIFFTGSIPVGSKIAQQAAKKLTPVTLELGGKSPAIVDSSANLKIAARRIAWGKFYNAGQTCVSPDYLLVEENVKDAFVEKMKEVLQEFYGEGTENNKDYTRILNEKRFDTLTAFLKQGRIILGGQHDKEKLYIAPTLMDEVKLDSPVMQEEIFGPILPVITFRKYEEAVQIIRRNPHPLSLYLFTSDKSKEKLIMEGVQFGGGAINDTIAHLSNPELPFGGIGNSGMGRYHGKYSFDTFTHQKSVIKNITWFDNKLRYPPYSLGKRKLAKWFIG